MKETWIGVTLQYKKGGYCIESHYIKLLFGFYFLNLNFRTHTDFYQTFGQYYWMTHQKKNTTNHNTGCLLNYCEILNAYISGKKYHFGAPLDVFLTETHVNLLWR